MRKLIIRLIILLVLVGASYAAFRVYQSLPQRGETLATAKVKQGDVVVRSFARGELRAVRSATLTAPNLFGTVQVTRLATLGALAREKDLVVRGVNLSNALEDIKNPLMCIVANGDGIVPPETAAFPFHATGARTKALLEVGDEEMAMAHADLFVSNAAHERVFAPVAAWLLDGQYGR